MIMMKAFSVILPTLLVAVDGFVIPTSSSSSSVSSNKLYASVDQTAKTNANTVNPQLTQECWNLLDEPPILCQGGNTLKTFTIPANDPAADSMQILMRAPGDRPIHSTIELWYTPSYLPTKIDVFLEDGQTYPLNCILDSKYANQQY